MTQMTQMTQMTHMITKIGMYKNRSGDLVEIVEIRDDQLGVWPIIDKGGFSYTRYGGASSCYNSETAKPTEEHYRDADLVEYINLNTRSITYETKSNKNK